MVRGRELGEGDEDEGGERGVGAAAWRRMEASRPSGTQAGRLEVAGHVPARGGHARCLLARGGRRQERRWWAGPACNSAGLKVSSLSLSFFPISFIWHIF